MSSAKWRPSCLSLNVLTLMGYLICVPFVHILCNILNPDKFTGFKTTIFIYSQKKKKKFTKHFINSLSQGQISLAQTKI